jgi:hypothetical protein
MSRTEDDQPPSDDPGLPAELARAIDDGHGAADLDGLYRALRADIARERGLRGWLRERSTAARLLAASGVIAGVCALAAVAFARSDLGAYPIERFVLSLSAMGLLMVVSLVIALRPLQRPGLPIWVSPAVAACSLLALAGLYLVTPLPPAPAALELASLRPALVCLAIGLAMGAPVYALIVLLERGGPRRALPMAAAAGLAANLVLHIHCPRTQLTHLMLGHFGAAALLLLAVALWTRARD